MDFIKISEKKIYQGRLESSSGSENESQSAERILDPSGYWCTKKRTTPIKEFVIIDFEEEIPFDYIKLTSSVNGTSTFPRGYRLEGGSDGKEWKCLYSETDATLSSTEHEISLPLNRLRYLKLVINESAVLNGQYYSEIGNIEAGLSGFASIEASSSSEGHTAEQMIDGNSQTYWESELKQNSSREIIDIDLGKVFNVNKLVMASTIDGFPENFSVEVSTDTEIWTTVLQEKNFLCENGKKYFWEIGVVPARFLRIECLSSQLINRKFGIKISELEIYSAIMSFDHIHNLGDITPYASVFQAGMVKMARDGESLSGAVVQSTDGRLRDASTVFKGIVQLANDGDMSQGLVVQADDSRLQPATEMKPGIVRLAYNRETNPNAVVQSNDSRLQHADEENFGIMKLCPDGDYKEHSVVTGNDSRLQKATIRDYGITRLAEDGKAEAGSVVQSNDRRLKDATRHTKGIVRLAEDGEVSDDAVVLGSDKRLKDATIARKGIVELAEDGEDREGVVVQGNDRRLKDATIDNKGIVELADDGEDKPGVAVQGNDKRLKDATVAEKGIVQLAENGSSKAGMAVQGNDKRLKEASETATGIMKFAVDGGVEDLTAVQGSDKRLKDATTISKGIVELADDGEDREGVVVQGNDHRLKDATIDNKGIVELAEDGEDKPGVAVQGNDSRLREASTLAKGIVQFAEDGERSVTKAVQSSDKRLRHASETATGIMKFAVDGGDEDLTAVQGSDKRLKDATTISKGIVELAEDGEDREGVVVQGNDRRLQEATYSNAGIVKVAPDGEANEKSVVQSNDRRLYNKREPLPHEHDYAPLNHGFDSHAGTLVIRESRNELFKGVTPPSDGSAVIYGKNTSGEDHTIGITGVAGTETGEGKVSYGVLGHGRHVGVRGQAPGNDGTGAGVVGVSRFGVGGVFSSEHGYSLVADGSGKSLGEIDKNIPLVGDRKALLVEGFSDFNGTLHINGEEDKNDTPGGIVEMFEVDEVEYVSPGDLLIVNEKGNSLLSKSRNSYNRSVIGVVSGNPKIVIDNSGKKDKLYPVALGGKVLCKVDARNNPVNPGDLIVTSNTAGCGMTGKIDSFDKVGTVIGKALDRLDDGVDLIPVFIMHQ